MITMDSLALQGATTARDTCPCCGDVRVTTDAGRLVALRLDGRGVCTCSPADRAAAEDAATQRMLAYVLGARPVGPARTGRGARPSGARARGASGGAGGGAKASTATALTGPTTVARALKHLTRLTAPQDARATREPRETRAPGVARDQEATVARRWTRASDVAPRFTPPRVTPARRPDAAPPVPPVATGAMPPQTPDAATALQFELFA